MWRIGLDWIGLDWIGSKGCGIVAYQWNYGSLLSWKQLGCNRSHTFSKQKNSMKWNERQSSPCLRNVHSGEVSLKKQKSVWLKREQLSTATHFPTAFAFSILCDGHSLSVAWRTVLYRTLRTGDRWLSTVHTDSFPRSSRRMNSSLS